MKIAFSLLLKCMLGNTHRNGLDEVIPMRITTKSTHLKRNKILREISAPDKKG